MGSGSLTELLQVRNLTKAFGPLVAVDDVSFSVPRGEVLGFLGPNGAGKSTTMKMITGFMAPTRGTAVVCGHDVVADPIEVKKSIGYLPEGAPLYGDMSARMMDVFAQFTPDIEVYSIDECFLDLSHAAAGDPVAYAQDIRRTVLQWTGLPVSLESIAATGSR